MTAAQGDVNMHYRQRHYALIAHFETLAPDVWIKFDDIGSKSAWNDRNRLNELVREGIVQRRRTPGGGGAAAYQYRLMKHQFAEDGQS